MKQKILSIFLAAILCLGAALPVFAAEEAHPPRVVDDAGLLSAGEEADLLAKLDEISQRQQVDIVVVTVYSLGGKSAMAYADDFFDYNGYGLGSSYDGILLLVSMESREWWISTCGYGITAFTDAGIDYISEQFLADLSEGYYAEAFTVFAEQCDIFLTQARTGSPYDIHSLPKEPFSALGTLVVALVIGLVAALIVTGVMKGQLKSVRRQSAAGDYVVRGSLNLSDSSELYLYRDVRRVRKAQNSGGSGTHRSSSGRSHGGRGGRF